ncbi:hypothetical protein C8P63_10938 [Melghirimyces profundicolus]|uniref:Uncharacterized protein n=1 Tax=Melghirimyces profundicolus TaxID=1242148 RepID=A0A2T6BW15_9BACL|nr:hypothetical protein [Melghirimyces profundicolus]PTX60274.1 hypothetical protein C8P63_10938 [Melghirimyces profundicolus]
MSDWEPQAVIALFFASGLLFSITGAWLIEKWIKRLRTRTRRRTLTVLPGGHQKAGQGSSVRFTEKKGR